METLHVLDAYPNTKDLIHYHQFINHKLFLSSKICPENKYRYFITLHSKINLWTSTHIETKRQRYQVRNQQ